MAPQKVEDLKSELKILLCMDHPHVVRLLDVYVSDTKLDMVMECPRPRGATSDTGRERQRSRNSDTQGMQGGELKKRCQQIRMEEEEVGMQSCGFAVESTFFLFLATNIMICQFVRSGNHRVASGTPLSICGVLRAAAFVLLRRRRLSGRCFWR